MSTLQELYPAIQRLGKSYQQNTSTSLKFIDVYLVFIMASGVFQFLYMLAVGTFPYNAFLAGFISTVGSFVLAANLRIQTNAQNSPDFKGISPERAFADFAICSILLHLFCVNFLG
ncbi:Dolichyl-diphosphooligosaccharide-protein glycosyltransferase subunit dad1 [Umbelopsis sp. WA50703]